MFVCYLLTLKGARSGLNSDGSQSESLLLCSLDYTKNLFAQIPL